MIRLAYCRNCECVRNVDETPADLGVIYWQHHPTDPSKDRKLECVALYCKTCQWTITTIFRDYP